MFFGILLGMFWGRWFPINKNLWSSSYVLFADCHASSGRIVDLLLGIRHMEVEIGLDLYLACFWNECNHGVRIRRAAIVQTVRNRRAHGNKNSKPKLVHVRPRISRRSPRIIWRRWLIPSVSSLSCFIPVAILYRKKIFLKGLIG